MKRIQALLMALLMLVSVAALSSCGNKKAIPNFDIPEGGYDGSEVTITFYHTMGSNLSDVLNLYIEEFNKLYPNIHIQHEQVGSYDDVRDQIGTELSTHSEPNIAYCYPDHVAMYNLTGAVATLDNLIDSKLSVTRADGSTEILGLTEEQKSDFIEAYYNEGRQFGDGLMYTMPFSKSTEVLYYNKTFFDANNLTLPKTWDELKDLCAKIKQIDPDSIPLGYDSEGNWFITMCEQYGSPYTSAKGDNYLFNNEKNREFVKEFRDWYQNGYITTQTLLGSYTSSLFTSTNGTRSYMSIGSSAGATHQRPAADTEGNYPFEVGIATIPQVNADKPKVISQGPSVCIFKKDNPQEVLASWLFIKYLTTNVSFQAEFSMASGYVPVLKSVAENPEYAKFIANADGGKYISALSAKVCLEQESAYYTSPAFNGSSKARSQVGTLLTKCLTIDKDADVDAEIKKAFEDAIAECEY
ncbi:aBC-type transport system substrate-binding component [Anaerotruncus sp. CAG:390]|nr:aBC-type transport system substrate-binding component [Anaerotruncus sp. CAG:390]